MRNIIIIIVLLLLSSCYTKNQAIKKFCVKDTITTFVITHDTIYTKTIQADTTFDDSNDTVIVERDRLVIRYIHKNNKVYLQGECKGDTIYLTKTRIIKTPVLIPGPTKLSIYEKAKNYLVQGFAFIGILLIVVLLVRNMMSRYL